MDVKDIIDSLVGFAPEMAAGLYDEGAKSGVPGAHNPQMVKDLAGHAAAEALRTLLSRANSNVHDCCDGIICTLVAMRTVELLLSEHSSVMRELMARGGMMPEQVRH